MQQIQKNSKNDKNYCEISEDEEEEKEEQSKNPEEEKEELKEQEEEEEIDYDSDEEIAELDILVAAYKKNEELFSTGYIREIINKLKNKYKELSEKNTLSEEKFDEVIEKLLSHIEYMKDIDKTIDSLEIPNEEEKEEEKEKEENYYSWRFVIISTTLIVGSCLLYFNSSEVF